MTVENRYAKALDRAAENLAGIAHVDLRPGRTIVCCVGSGLREAQGTAAQIFAAVHAAGVNIEMISTSAIRISCVVREDQAEQAVTVLHAAFELDKAPADRTDI